MVVISDWVIFYRKILYAEKLSAEIAGHQIHECWGLMDDKTSESTSPRLSTPTIPMRLRIQQLLNLQFLGMFSRINDMKSWQH